jgi:hypothetical protein
MKKWHILLGIVLVLLIAGYFTVSHYAVAFLQERLQKAVVQGFTVAEIQMRLTCLSVKGIRYEEPHSKQALLQAKEMRIYPAVIPFLSGTLRIRKCSLIEPAFSFSRSPEGSYTGPWAAVAREEGKGEKQADEPKKDEKERIRVQVDRIQIYKGNLLFEDNKTGAAPERIEFGDLEMEIKDVSFPPVSNHSFIELKAKIKGTKEGIIESKGWLDFITLDTESSLHVQNLEVKLFEPYYRKRVSTEIEEGKMNIEAKVAAKGRKIDVAGEMELSGLRMKEEGTFFWVPAKTIVTLFKNRGDRVKGPFHVKGNLDDPRFVFHEALLMSMAFSFGESLGIPVRVITGSEGTGEDNKGAAEGMKSLRELFKKKKEKKQ